MGGKLLLAALLLSAAAVPAQAACRDEIAEVDRHIARLQAEGKPAQPVEVVVRQPETGATRVVDVGKTDAGKTDAGKTDAGKEAEPTTQAAAADKPGDAKVAPPDKPGKSGPQESWFVGQPVRELLDDARDMAANGNEGGCRDNVLRVKRILELAPPAATEPAKQ